jgi:hypothetical protein
LSFATGSFSGTAPICPTCGRTPSCPPDIAITDPTCGGGTFAQRQPDPTPTPTPTPTPSK